MSNPIRFGGFASGMDTDSIVKQLTQAKRAKVDKYSQRKTKNEWRQEAYQKLSKNLANFILDSRKKLGLTKHTYTGQPYPNSIDNVDWGKKATVENEEFFTASASAGASEGQYQVQVKSLAKAASITGKAVAVNQTDKIVEQDITLKFQINGEEKTVDLKTSDTVSDVIKKLKKETGLNISFGKVGRDSSGKETSMLFMSTKLTGAGQEIKSEDEKTQAFFFKKLGLEEHALSIGSKGQNSVVNINGSDIENQSNEIDINGLKLSLKKESTSVQNVSISANVDGIYNKIKEFVDGYNKIIDEMQSQISEKVYKDFHPLTKEQKEAMKDEEIKLWEEKAKSGLLNNDSITKSMISKMRIGMYEKVEGASSIYEMGISTGSFKNGAKLEINETKLREALSKDPQKVLDTLFKSPDDIKNYEIQKNDSPTVITEKRAMQKKQRENTGAFIRIMQDMASGIESMVKQGGVGKDSTSLLKNVKGNILSGFLSGKSAIDLETVSINKMIDLENERIESYEASLWKKFGAMEKAMQQMQAQSSWLAQQFGAR